VGLPEDADHAALDAATTVHVRGLHSAVGALVSPFGSRAGIVAAAIAKSTAVRETARDYKGAIQPHGSTLK